MNRAEIRDEIARLISESVKTAETFDEKAERVLRFLEDIGFDTEMSLAEREGRRVFG